MPCFAVLVSHAVVVAEAAGINGGATLLAFRGGPVGVLLVLPRVVDERAEQAGAFGGWAAVELLGTGVDGGI
ncbi:hypothetical protein ABRP69_10020 [Corynebacterium sp. KPL3806]|uniref:hypothetical protein n=1 Tax=Corynebacterium sp. KPL3806 TaxID=3158323 RepID=UPI0032EE8967